MSRLIDLRIKFRLSTLNINNVYKVFIFAEYFNVLWNV